jgi:hypothetical protein
MATKGEDPTKAPVDRLMDASMIYLHQHDLEAAVCAALVKVVNERASNPRERMAELLLGSNEVMSKQATKQFDKQIADLQSEKLELQNEIERNRVRAQELADQITATNEEYIEHINAAAERTAELERWVREANDNPAAASRPTPPPAAPPPKPIATPTPKPAAAPSPAAAAKPADTRSVMGKLFNTLQPKEGGVIAQSRLTAFAVTLEVRHAQPTARYRTPSFPYVLPPPHAPALRPTLPP